MLTLHSERMMMTAGGSDPYEPSTVLFESSTYGNYTVNVEDGVYELVMCGGGGKGYRWDISGIGRDVYCWMGMSGAYFKGEVKLKKGTYSIQVGNIGTAEDNYNGFVRYHTIFDKYITCETAKYAYKKISQAWTEADTTIALDILDSSIIVKTDVSGNGVGGKFGYDLSRTEKYYTNLPEPYKSAYGYGGPANTSSGYSGGPAYVKLQYLRRR